jgi:superfamily I DNA/RNA helicase
MTIRLAEAVTDFHFSFEAGNQRHALEELHRIVLELEGDLEGISYHQHLKALGFDRFVWRPRILQLARDLRYDPAVYATADAWHDRAKAVLAPCLPAGGPSINQRLRKTNELAGALRAAPAACTPAKTIHSVKGMQFPAVCVVMTSKKAKGILDYLETGSPADCAEDSREIYVAASRAERLLVIAIPKSQAKRLSDHIGNTGAQVTVVPL